MNSFFRIVSVVFMPLTMPLIALAIVFYAPSYLDFSNQQDSLYFLSPSVKQFYFNSFALFSWVFPVVSILILRFTKQIDSIEIDQQNQRFIPLILTGMYASMLLFLLYKFNLQIHVSMHLFSLALSGLLLAIIFGLINLTFKISLHAGGVGILLGFVLAYYMDQFIVNAWFIYFACLLGGVVISSRIKLQKHSNKELILGFVVGFFTTFIIDILLILNLKS